MEKKESLAPKVYYFKEVEDENGERMVVVEDKAELGVPYTTKEIIDEKGIVHIIFWKVSNFK